jgi:DNA-binding NarL/FixJ family response regulator
MRKRGKVLPVRELVELGATNLPGTVTIDVEATSELGMPMLVLSPRVASRLALLSPREFEIAALIADGCLNKEIADRLGLTIGTVKNYVHRIIGKTALPNRAAIASAFTGRTPGTRRRR